MDKNVVLRNGIEISVYNFNKVTRRKAIYIIVNTVNSKVYVGSSVDVGKRRSSHFRSLDKNKHPNKHLQSAYNKYSKDAFAMHLLEYVDDESNLLEREQYWINTTKSYDRNVGYNNSPSAFNSLGVKHSEESKKIRSISSVGENNPMFGKKHKEETLKLMSDNRGKTSVFQYDLKGNFIKEWIDGATEAQEIKGFSRNCIYQCCIHKNKQHKGYIWVTKEEATQENFNINNLIPKQYMSANKPIYQYDMDGNIIKEWNNVSEASRELKLSRQRIIKCCKEEINSYKNFAFKYKLN